MKRRMGKVHPGRILGRFLKQIVLPVVLMLAVQVSYAQEISVSGKVSDETGMSMIGVNVIIKGTTNGTVTDFDGNFTVKAQSTDVLVFSYIGYQDKEVSVAGQSTINVSLDPDTENIDEVVVVGYGVQKKSDVTGSVASIKSEELSQMKVTGVGQAMQGRAAGVSVTTNSGSPGADPMVVIRGVGSINGSSPLWVIDGVPAEGLHVNAADIESMEILKDASSCAIYGSRGADGVILITTKKGKKGKGQVTYDGYVQMGQAAKKLEMVTASDWGRLRESALLNSGYQVNGDIANWPTLGEGTFWQDEVLRTALTHDHNISFSGASDKLSYYLSVNHHDEEGIIKKSNYKRTTLRLNTTYKVKDWLTIGENLSVAGEITNRVNEDDEWNAIMVQAIAKDPITKPNKDENGLWDPANFTTMQHPVAHIDRTNNQDEDVSVGGNIYANFDFNQFVEGLTFKSDVGYSRAVNTSWAYEPVWFVKDGEENSTSSLAQGFYQSQQLNFVNYATYAKSFGQHNLSVMGGTEFLNINQNWFGLTVTDLISDELRLIQVKNASGNQNAITYGDAYEKAIWSYMGRLNYDFASKYLVTMNLRHDASSIFGPDHKSGLFPSFSLGWKVSDEAFMQGVGVINNLKLRAGFGSIGNDKIQSFRYYSNSSTGMRYPIGGTIVDGAAFINYGNTFIHWEGQYTTNIAVDIAMFENIFTATLDLYDKRSVGMLFNPPVPAHVGAEEAPFDNVGSMVNKGVELELGYKKLFGDLKVDVSGSVTYNKNELLSLGVDDAYIMSARFQGLGNISRTEEGHPVASFYGAKCDGIFQNWEEVNAHVGPDGELIQEKAQPGDIRFKDEDGDGKVDEDFIGSPFPDFTFGLNTSLSYRGFDFSLFIQGTQGQEVFNASKYYTHNPTTEYGMSVDMNDAWNEFNQIDDVNTPRIAFNDDNLNTRKSDRYIEDGSYLRIKNVQLGYTLPQNLFSNKISHLRFYVGGSNLYTLTKYSGLDPEVGMGYDGVLDIGIDRGNYPSPRTFVLGMTCKF